MTKESKRVTRRDFLKVAGAAAAGGLLAACGPTPTPERIVETVEVEKIVEKVVTPTPAPTVLKPVTISYWMHLNLPKDPVWYEILDDFHATHPMIRVDFYEAPWKTMHDELVTAIAAGAAPDCHEVHFAWIGELSRMGAIIPLDDYVAQWDGANDYLDSIWTLLRDSPDKPLYVITKEALADYIYYRRDWFEEEGLEVPQNHDEFLEVAKALTQLPDRYGYHIRGAKGGSLFAYDFVHGDGFEVIDEEGNVVCNNEVAVEAWEWFVDMYRKHKVVPESSITDGWPQMFEAFQGGKTAMLCHTGNTRFYVEEALGDKASAFAIPAGKVRSFASARLSATGISTQTKEKEACWEFTRFICEKPQVDKWALNPGAGSMPILKSQAEDPRFTGDRFLKAGLDSADYWGKPPYFHPRYGDYYEHVWPANFQRCLLGEISVKEMLDKFAEQFSM